MREDTKENDIHNTEGEKGLGVTTQDGTEMPLWGKRAMEARKQNRKTLGEGLVPSLKVWEFFKILKKKEKKRGNWEKLYLGEKKSDRHLKGNRL